MLPICAGRLLTWKVALSASLSARPAVKRSLVCMPTSLTGSLRNRLQMTRKALSSPPWPIGVTSGRGGLSKAFEAIDGSRRYRVGRDPAREHRQRPSVTGFELSIAFVTVQPPPSSMRQRFKEITRRVTNHAASGVVDRYIHDDIEAIRAATALVPRLPKGPLP